MAKENQRKNHREGHPQGELLIDRHCGEGVEEKVAGHGDGDGGGVIDVHGADEVTLLALEFEPAVAAVAVHFERFLVQLPDTAARAAQAHAVAEHLEQSSGHFKRPTAQARGRV